MDSLRKLLKPVETLDQRQSGGGSLQPALRPLEPPCVHESPTALADLDTQLMLRVRDGDKDAFNTLIRRHAERVERYISRLIRQSRAAEDLAQDVFMQVLTSAPRYAPTAKFSTWLYRIATNTAKNYLNCAHVRRSGPSLPDASFDCFDERTPAPERGLSLDELRTAVAESIGALPVNQRIALTLFQYEELSYEQIACVLNVTVDSVRSLLKRARDELRARLAGLL